jgi:hypothetical protein
MMVVFNQDQLPEIPMAAEDAAKWKAFQEAGLLWWVNRMLHLFGWVINMAVNSETGDVHRVWVDRCEYTGFSRESEERGFERLKRHMWEISQ